MSSESLGAFLRRHREGTPPPDALASAPRRRVKGLRRSEVASLAGITEQWYALLERGRASTTSPELLRKLAEVFGLSPAESEELFALAGVAPSGAPQAPDSRVSDSLRQLADAQYPSPAYVVDSRWDVLAWNESGEAMVRELATSPRERRNALWALFGYPSVRGSLQEWESLVSAAVPYLRRDYDARPDDPRLRGLVAGLLESSEEFRECWAHQGDGGAVRSSLAFARRDARLEFELVTMLQDETDLRMIVLLPARGSDTERWIRRRVTELRRRRAASRKRLGLATDLPPG